MLERDTAKEALRVQVRSPGSSSGFFPNAQSRSTKENYFSGHYTPEIDRMMAAPRPDCDRYKNSAFTQGACRRELTVSIVRD